MTDRGFTLIEVLIVMAIVSILTAIAYPSYQDHLRKGRRAEAKALLQEVVGLQERYYTTNNTYADTFAKLGYATSPVTTNSAYTVALAPTAAGWINGVNVTATLSSAFTDPRCGALTLSSTGARTTSVAPGTGCW